MILYLNVNYYGYIFLHYKNAVVCKCLHWFKNYVSAAFFISGLIPNIDIKMYLAFGSYISLFFANKF